MRIRRAAVAGSFYPGRADSLRAALDDALAGAVRPDPTAPVPQAIVVPHAGYVYSAPVAASAYVRVAPARDRFRRVVLLGPSHHVAFRGAAVPSADAFETPLGLVAVDPALRDRALGVPGVVLDDLPHAREHSLEVQLPFLQTVLDDATVLPVVVGDATPAAVAALLDACWTDDETLLVVSTDLSHYLRYAEAARLDAHTAEAIVARRADLIGGRAACGSRPLAGLLTVATQRGLDVVRLDLRSSGDTAGDHERVVGYGAFAIL